MNPYPGRNEIQLIALFNAIAEILNLTITSRGIAHVLFQEIAKLVEITNHGDGNFEICRKGRYRMIRVSFGTYDPAPTLSVEISSKGSRSVAVLQFQLDKVYVQNFDKAKWLRNCKDEDVRRIFSVLKSYPRSPNTWKKMEFQPTNQSARFCSA